LARNGEKKMKKLIFVLFLSVFASSASATVYKWVDERGVVNFADDLDKVPPVYRNSVEEAKTPKMPTQPSFQSRPVTTVVNTQSGKASTQAPSIAQTLIREGDFAMRLADKLKIGTPQNEAEAESMLASSGIAPRNGWIADYPVTPDIIGELQNTVSGAVGSGKLAVNKDEAMKTFQDLIAQQGLPVRAESENQYPGGGSQQPYAEEAPPQDYPQYYDPSVIDDYYNDQGPPVVSYYPPPPDYGYLYSWVPYPFWCTGFWFPGFFVLHDFHRPFFANGNRRFISNHFWDSGRRGFGTIDPARRHMGNALANLSHPTRGFTSHAANNGASSILRRNLEHTSINRPGGISGNRGGSNLPSVRGGLSGARPSTGYGPPSTGYSPGRRIPSSRPTYGGSFSHGSSFSHSGMGSARSFSPPSRSGGSGFHGGGFGSRGFSGGGGGRGSSGGGGRGRR
jgi:Domain of unknown function (DUF4124)